MKAFEARTKYFEKHVWFEHHVYSLAQSLNIITEQKSLSSVINEVVSHNKFKFLKLTSSELKNQKNLRNWLAHQHSNTTALIGMIKQFELVDSLNDKLVNAHKWVINDNKKQHPKERLCLGYTTHCISGSYKTSIS